MFVLDFRLTCMVLPLMPLFFVFRSYFENRLRAASDAHTAVQPRKQLLARAFGLHHPNPALAPGEESNVRIHGAARRRMEALNHRV